MDKKRTIALMASAMVALFALSGCTSEKSNVKQSIVSTAQADQQKPEDKIFEPGQHFYYVYQRLINTDGDQIPIPEGYAIFDVDYASRLVVCFINIETVEAKPVYNALTKKYSYSKPGKVVQIEHQK